MMEDLGAGWPALLAAALLVGSGISVVLRARRADARPRGPALCEQTMGAAARCLTASLDDADLARAWRVSEARLMQLETPTERLTLVRLREACLDEIERRHPLDMRAFLDGGGIGAPPATSEGPGDRAG